MLRNFVVTTLELVLRDAAGDCDDDSVVFAPANQFGNYLHSPERPVVTFTGDAGFWYHIGEIETAVRWKINAVTVVNNNGGGNQSKRGFDRVYGGNPTDKSRELWTYTKVNFAKIAEDIGAVGIRVEKASEFAPALQKALTL